MRRGITTVVLVSGLLFHPAVVSEVAGEASSLQRKALRYFDPLPAAMPGAEQDTSEKVALGKKLYFDVRLSVNNTQSCNSCHRLDDNLAGVDNLALSPGAHGKTGTRNAPTVLNAGWHVSQFWDGRADDLVEQAKAPILNPVEMAMPDEMSVVKKLRAMEEYVASFRNAFPGVEDAVTYQHLAEAIAAFERTLRTQDRFDDFLAGNEGALSQQERNGLRAFIKLNCISCHDGPLLGGELFEKLGKENEYEDQSDTGLFALTGDKEDWMIFKVPSLRNVALTAPYFHNGKVATLEEAVRKMAWLQLNEKPGEKELSDIVAFLNSLSDKARSPLR
jgi:cytochrome c peroxidase